MRISFTKGNGKFDQMRIHRADATDVIDCPKQRIIPHDLMHYAVENTLQKRGFLARIRDAEVADFQMLSESESDGVERLVEVFQGDAWSGATSTPAELLALYQVTCRARACMPIALTENDVVMVRSRIDALDQQWQALPVGLTLSVEL